ncbi:Uncharacterized protein LOK49_LG02G00834 [Camellia lanceoleosa]|uniref:Uncharacterized protein n=1 Tax=Camellia lanceoleosa TaxID=1840588 RepID=A0ACC0ILC3_9ERIC|nr:Uncharacterized protein LOK49_LG02G00834 [Camellia lanceoleosa]
MSSMMVDSLLDLMRTLSLTSEEDTVVNLSGDSTTLMRGKSDLCLVGKLLTRRPVNFDAMQSTLSSVWQPTKGMQVRVFGDNLFVFVFGHAVDKRRVLSNGRWTFDKHLLMLGEMDPTVQPSDIRLIMVHFWVHVCNLPLILMNKEVGQIVGNTIGQFLDMDFEDGGIAWGRTMRIRVAIDVRKPLRWGMKLSLSLTDPIWVDFKYERLPIFCYFCGLLGHTDRDCDAKLSSAEGSRIDVMQYGAWLRMDNFKAKGARRNGPTYRGDEVRSPVDQGTSTRLASVYRKEDEGPLPSIPKPGAPADVVPAQHRDRDVHVGQSLFPVIDGVCPETAPTQIEPVPVAKSSPIVPTALMEIEARPLGVTMLGKKKWKKVARQHMESTTVHSPDTRNKRVLEEVAACGVPQGDEASEQHIGKRLCMLGDVRSLVSTISLVSSSFLPDGSVRFWVCVKNGEGENRATTAVAYSKLQFSNRCRNTE